MKKNGKKIRKEVFFMNKKIMSTIIAASALLQAFAIPASAEENEKFVLKSIPCAEGESYFNEDYQKYDSMLLRYADDKTPIPFSEYYDGYMYCKIPVENKDREVEMFLSEPLSFSDYDEEKDGFYTMERLSRTGVIKGDSEGRANPEADVTRAEACAMVMRLMGVDAIGKPDSGFEDVPENSWYANTVARAKDYGIVEGDSDKVFSPDRNVSREEMVVMVARALQSVGFVKLDENATRDDLYPYMVIDTLRDKDKVSDWAISAYKLLGDYVTRDFEEPELSKEELEQTEDIPYNIYISPQKKALRSDVADLVENARESFQIYPSQTAIKYGFDKKMPVIDGSTSTYPFTEAIYANLFSNGYNHPEKPAKHSKSHKTYERLIAGEIDAMIASVYPAEDILALAKENNVELELIPIAYDAMVFFTNKDNPAKGLTTQQITDIYVDNKYSNWKELGGSDSVLYPYARNYDSGSHAQMERHFLKGKDINDKIRRETTSVSMANVLTDVMDAETEEPKGFGLGYSIYYYFKNMDLFYETDTYLKLLEIDGVAPTDDTIADGSYPLSNNTYVVIRKDEPEDSVARRFADFMLSDLGQECVNQAGFGPLKKNK